MNNLFKILSVCAILLPAIVNGQEIKEGPIKTGKEERAGYIAVSKYNTTLVKTALEQKLTAAGLGKARKKSKFYTYKEVTVPDISPTKIDLYYAVQKKKHRSKICFIVSKGYNNYVTSGTDAATSANITSFLGQIDGIVAHNEEIRLQEEAVNAANEQLAQKAKELQKTQDKKDKEAKALEALKKQ